MVTTITAYIFIVPALAFVLFYLYTSRKFNYWKKRNIPFKKPLPFFGSLFEVFTFKKGLGDALCSFHLEKSDTPYVGFYLTSEPALLVKNPHLIKELLVKKFSAFTSRNVASPNEHDKIGSNLIFLMGRHDWDVFRKISSPAYTTGKIRSMYGLFAESGKEMVTYLDETIKINSVVNIKDVCVRYASESITSTAFGLKANSFKKSHSDFLAASLRVFDFNIISIAFSTTCYLIAPRLVKLLKLYFVDAKSGNFLKQAFWETVRTREAGNVSRNDVIDIILEARKNDKYKENAELDHKLLGVAVNFFIGGSETTTTTLVFVLYELAKHPEIQSKLREEIQDAIHVHGSLNYDTTTKELKYLDMVLKETLRLHPILGYLDRRCEVDYQIPGTTDVIEKEVGVYVSVLGLHMDPNNFPNPEEFIPERFAEENLEFIKPFTYLPFGEGPRKCIGARFADISIKCAMANFISNFEFALPEGCPRKLEHHPRGFLLSPKATVLLNVNRINNE